MLSIRLSLLVALSLAAASLQTKNPINDFCRRWGHQTARVGGKLYIDGGLVAWNPLSTNPLNYTSTTAIARRNDFRADGPQTHGSSTATSIHRLKKSECPINMRT